MIFTSYESSMMAMLTFRPAVSSDAGDLFTWRNDPDSRAASLSQDVVSRDGHDRWFASSLESTTRWIYLAVDEESGSSVGVCRFDLAEQDATAEVSINLNPNWRGRGLSGTVLTGGIAAFRAASALAVPLTATIRSSNAASARIFTAAGFVPVGADGDIDYYRLGRPIRLDWGRPRR
jgi:RimJ/RimL family protein N-acetyltransferase